MSDEVKAVVAYRYYNGRRRDNTTKHGQRHLVRVVSAIEKVREHDGPPFRWDGHTQARWAEDLTWTLYKGVVQYKGNPMRVYGWSFVEDVLPRFWAWDDSQSRHEEIAAWGWLAYQDIPDLDKYLEAMHQPAFGQIRRKLGQKEAYEAIGPLGDKEPA